MWHLWIYIKKFYLDDVIDGAAHIPHPAFIVEGKELDGIYISKFQNALFFFFFIIQIRNWI